MPQTTPEPYIFRVNLDAPKYYIFKIKIPLKCELASDISFS